MRRRAAGSFALGGLLLLACNALTGVSDLEVDERSEPLPDASRPEDDAAATDSAIDAIANDGSVADVVEEDAPVDPSLVGFWTFDETSGDVSADRSGNGHDAMLVGATFAPTAGIRGGAVSLGAGMFVAIDTLASPAFPATGTFSIWLRWRTMVAMSQHGILDVYSDTRNHVFIRHPNDSPAGELQIALQPLSNQYVWAHDFIVPQDEWTHVVVTWAQAAGRATAFVNGTKVKDAAYAEPFVPSEQVMRLGASFDGWLDEARLYDRALTDVEAAALP